MTVDALGWLLINLIAVTISGYYSMIEMAAVSFNTVRLQYYVSKKIKQAVWLNALLKNPTMLFGTTLIGVNLANTISSECGREMYSALGWNPDFSALTQVPLVVVLSDLVPMFAARRYPEHVVMCATAPLVVTSKLLKPILWIISQITRFCQFLLGAHAANDRIFMTQEELLKIVENKHDARFSGSDTDVFNATAANIFLLRHKTASDIMRPLSQYKMLPSGSTVRDMRQLMAKTNAPFFPIFQRQLANIVGIAFPRDMTRANDNHRARDRARPIWFITLDTPVMDILQQFRKNRHNVGVVINHEGAAVGLIPLDTLIEEIISPGKEQNDEAPRVIIDKTVPGSMTVAAFNKQFRVTLSADRQMTLMALVEEALGRPPEADDSIIIEPYQLTVHGKEEIHISTRL